MAMCGCAEARGVDNKAGVLAQRHAGRCHRGCSVTRAWSTAVAEDVLFRR